MLAIIHANRPFWQRHFETKEGDRPQTLPAALNEHDILNFIRQDKWMMRVLDAAAALDLPDWMIGAGFIRNKVWDHLHGFANDAASPSPCGRES